MKLKCRVLENILAVLIVVWNIFLATVLLWISLILGTVTNIVIGVLIGGVMSAIGISLLTHMIAWYKCEENMIKATRKVNVNLMYIISFDFALSAYYKGRIKIQQSSDDNDKSIKDKGALTREYILRD